MKDSIYCNDLKFSDKQVWANSVDSDLEKQSDQVLHYLPFRLYLLDALLFGKNGLV